MIRIDAIGRAARSALQDAATAEVVSALETGGTPSIVLKGPSIDRLLYGDGGERSYQDSDLLLAPERIDAARAEQRGLDLAAYTTPYGEA